MLYLIKEYGKENQYLKIGSSDNLKNRFKQYNTCCAEYEVLDTFEGSYEEESILRNVFKDLIVRNEWMLYDEKIISMWNGYKTLYNYFKDIKDKYKTLENQYSELFLENQKLRTDNFQLKNYANQYSELLERALKCSEESQNTIKYITKLENH